MARPHVNTRGNYAAFPFAVQWRIIEGTSPNERLIQKCIAIVARGWCTGTEFLVQRHSGRVQLQGMSSLRRRPKRKKKKKKATRPRQRHAILRRAALYASSCQEGRATTRSSCLFENANAIGLYVIAGVFVARRRSTCFANCPTKTLDTSR